MSVPRKTNGWVRVDTRERGNVFIFIGGASAQQSGLPVLDVGSGSMAIKQDGKKYLFHEDTGWVEVQTGGYPEPQGTKNITITENGTFTENVKAYASAGITVNVQSSIALKKLIEGAAYTYESDASHVRGYAFAGFNAAGESLSISLPECTYTGSQSFGNISVGELNISLPSMTELGHFAFYYATATTKKPLLLPQIREISDRAFYSCTCFSVVDCGSNISEIGGYAFSYAACDVIIRANSIVAIDDDTPFSGFEGNIYVPDNLVQTYKVATNWAEYSDIIHSINEL